MRAVITETAASATATILPRRDLFAALFLVWWIALWAVGEATLIGVMAGGTQALLSGSVPNTISTFRYLWPLIGAGLVAWSVLGGAMIFALVWELLGHEVIAASAGGLSVQRRIGAISSAKSHSARAGSLRAAPSASWRDSNLEFWGLGGGQIVLETGGRAIRCGRGISAEDARRIVESLRPRLPA